MRTENFINTQKKKKNPTTHCEQQIRMRIRQREREKYWILLFEIYDNLESH